MVWMGMMVGRRTARAAELKVDNLRIATLSVQLQFSRASTLCSDGFSFFTIINIFVTWH